MSNWLIAVALCLLPALHTQAQPVDRCGVRPQDQFVTVSSRGAGCTTHAERLANCLRYSAYEVVDESGRRQWRRGDVSEFLSWHEPHVPTIVFFHGNQVASNEAASEGLIAYRALVRNAADERPIRFVVWSWPSEKTGGILYDVRQKALRTRPVGWQAAWVLDQLPADLQVSLFGYSYGARVASGAAHLLAGGELSGLSLVSRSDSPRSEMRGVFLAAAMHANWLGPGQYHSMAMQQIGQLLLVNNPSDPAMRYYHFSTTAGNPQALGLCGPTCIDSETAARIYECNASGYVGNKHELARYVASRQVMALAWQYLTFADE